MRLKGRFHMKTVAGLLISTFFIAASVASLQAQTWDKQMNSLGRFEVLRQFNDEAVLDKETGLVWQRSPDTEWQPYSVAAFRCILGPIGGRRGFRLPAVHELASLVDPSRTDLALPPGHPFQNIVGTYYWSATTDAGDPTRVWTLEFGVGGPEPNFRSDSWRFWCVRSGQGIDTQ